MNEFFSPDSEIVTYESADEAIEKFTYLLEHEEERAEIARMGQKRTLNDHTVLDRCHQFHSIVEGIL